jgi:two-component system response regulator AtoC
VSDAPATPHGSWIVKAWILTRAVTEWPYPAIAHPPARSVPGTMSSMASEPRNGARDSVSTAPLSEDERRALLSREEPRLSVAIYHRRGVDVALIGPGCAVVVGRTAPSDLCIDDPTLSRQHARFTQVDSQVLVEDLGSTNGTWIAGQRTPQAMLSVGAEAMLGSLVARIQMQGATHDSATPASTAEELIERARAMLGHAGDDQPVQIAPPTAWVESKLPADPDPIVAGAAMRALLETVNRVANARIPVILYGETGTGKEVVAHLLHERGPRRQRPMVRVNCGAIPAHLVESTLFGHEKGAFTGATQQQRGVFEEADGGTVFLDEIGELLAPAQVALLRVLETGRFCRVGSAREIAVDVRIVAATHRDLEAMAGEGGFRSDLLYRLDTITLAIPPLRQRGDEIEPLALRFLAQANQANGRGVRGISSHAMDLLRAYGWPGNVRELRNAIERAVVVTSGDVIEPRDLPARVHARHGITAPHPAAAELAPGASPSGATPAAPGGDEFRSRMQHYEARIIAEALATSGWSRATAARLLGMPLRTLAHKIKVLGIKESGG